MELNSKDYETIDKASMEYFRDKEINTKCSRCGSEIVCIDYGNSYEIKCKKNNCISEVFRGI